MDMDILFRREAIDALSDRMGSPVKGFGVGMRIAVAFSGLVVISAMLLLARASYARKEVVPGWIVPDKGTIEVASARPGVVDRVFVHDGQHVAIGDPIVSVSAETTTSDGGALAASIEASVLEQLEANRTEATAAAQIVDNAMSALRQRQTMLQGQLETLASEVALGRERLALAEHTVSDLEPLVAQRLISLLQYREAMAARIEASHAVLSLQRNQAEARQALAQTGLDLLNAKAEAKARLARHAEARLQLEEKLVNIRAGATFIVPAKAAGTVTSLRAKVGAATGPEDSVAIILPDDSKLHAELWVPSSAIGFIDEGTEVHIMYDAYPYQKYGVASGKISGIAKAPVETRQLPMFVHSEEARYRVLVNLDQAGLPAFGRAQTLIPGMRLTADLVLERRTLGEWLLEPVLAVKHREGAAAAR